MEKEIWSYQIEMDTCPHCKEKININYTSYKSEKDLLLNFFKRINFHTENQCKNNNIKKVNSATVKTRLIDNTKKFETINLLF